jgi:hypothetical protein
MGRFQSRTRSCIFASYAALTSLFSVGFIQHAAAEDTKWWPSEWGAEDQKGQLTALRPSAFCQRYSWP